MTRMTGCNRDLIRRQHVIPQVLELWRTRRINTMAIAGEVGISEDEVCAILDEAEGREQKFEGLVG